MEKTYQANRLASHHRCFFGQSILLDSYSYTDGFDICSTDYIIFLKNKPVGYFDNDFCHWPRYNSIIFMEENNNPKSSGK